ncbi:hypothetical protein [Amycolatopsis suaedae]|uniref:Uncharacterized protein n=1 Tax=Amycolatopsis suaedae TaxID=2510978 RepID=A0A4Q7J8M2_9PSEU|nr:hypothetical protein [Amycolatopsis suaedae]RZQ63266.1 hypothetical protein EWH70_15440 [Amycolatopsis suaedae]
MAWVTGFPLTNLLLYAVVVLSPSLAFWLVLRGCALVRRWRQRRRPTVADGPPIQVVAADLRRVRRLLAQYGPGTPAARRLGARQAYDALLVRACTAVGVEHRLAEVPEGMDRDIERLRVEEALRGAGLVL